MDDGRPGYTTLQGTTGEPVAEIVTVPKKGKGKAEAAAAAAAAAAVAAAGEGARAKQEADAPGDSNMTKTAKAKARKKTRMMQIVSAAKSSVEWNDLAKCRAVLADIGTLAKDSRTQLNGQRESLEMCIERLEDASDKEDNDDDDVEEEEVTCAICFDGPPTIVWVDCGHKTVCTGCAMKQMELDQQCPTCRTPVITDPVRSKPGRVANADTGRYDGCPTCDSTKEPAAMLMPCNHTITCLDCANAGGPDGGAMQKCPLCNADVVSIVKIFFD